MERNPSTCCLNKFAFRAPVISIGYAISLQRIRISHPCGLRLWRAANSSGPWLNLSPRKSSVPDRVQLKLRSDLWFPAGMAGQPHGGSRPGRIRQTRAAPGFCCGWGSCQSGLVVIGQPQFWFTAPAILNDQSTSRLQRVPGHAARKSRPAPACAPPLYEPPRLCFAHFCVDKTSV